MSWGPVPVVNEVLVIIRVHEPAATPGSMKLPPDALLLVLLTEVSVKEVALLVKARVTGTFTSTALKTCPLANRKLALFSSLGVALTRRVMAGFDVVVIYPFYKVMVFVLLSKVQGFNVITSFTCGPAPGA